VSTKRGTRRADPTAATANARRGTPIRAWGSRQLRRKGHGLLRHEINFDVNFEGEGWNPDGTEVDSEVNSKGEKWVAWVRVGSKRGDGWRWNSWRARIGTVLDPVGCMHGGEGVGLAQGRRGSLR